MSVNCGATTFPGGTGTKILSLGLTPTWMEIEVGGAGYKHMNGFIYGGSQYCYSDENAAIISGKAIQLKDNTGAVVLEATWTSFASGNATFNVTTAPATMPQMFIKFGN